MGDLPAPVNIWFGSVTMIENTPYVGEWVEYAQKLVKYLNWLGEWAPVLMRSQVAAIPLVEFCLEEDWDQVGIYLQSLELDMRQQDAPRKDDPPSALFERVSYAVQLIQADPPPRRPEGEPQIAGFTVVDGGKADPAATASKLPAGVPPAPRLDPAPDPVVHPDRGQQDATPAPSPAPHARTTPPPVRVSPIAAPAAPSDLSHPEDVSPASSPATAEKAAEGA
tara:strand:+ start:430 stop:1098 length:669 start_codon:yes stop_codon:yes gene_type:complete